MAKVGALTPPAPYCCVILAAHLTSLSPLFLIHKLGDIMLPMRMRGDTRFCGEDASPPPLAPATLPASFSTLTSRGCPVPAAHSEADGPLPFSLSSPHTCQLISSRPRRQVLGPGAHTPGPRYWAHQLRADLLPTPQLLLLSFPSRKCPHPPDSGKRSS